MERELGEEGGKGRLCLAEPRRPRCCLSSLSCQSSLWDNHGSASKGTFPSEPWARPEAGVRGSSEQTFIAERGENQCSCKDLQERLHFGQQGKVHE